MPKTPTRKRARASARPAAPERAPKVQVRSVTPFLWFEKDAAAAARFYVSLIKGSRMRTQTPMSVEFTLAGQRFLALEGGRAPAPTPAFSILVLVRTQREVDALWDALTEGGEESMCGWLVDRFGISWQIIPEKLPKLLFHKDAEVAKRATEAMLKMRKIEIAALEKAAKKK